MEGRGGLGGKGWKIVAGDLVGGMDGVSTAPPLALQSNRPMKFGVVVFPGSNCDHDAWFAVSNNLGQQAEMIWHDAISVGDVDAVILPGGFAYGDYLRCGAIAKFSPVRQIVRKFAAGGGLVLGICNGFQIPVQCGMLPGALVRNRA